MARPPFAHAERSSHAAHIVPNDGSPVIPCVLQSFSDSGAVLRLHVMAAVPTAFRLGFGDAPPRPCWILRRAGREITVAFTDWAPEEIAS